MTVSRVQGATNPWVGDHQAVYIADGNKGEVRRDKAATAKENLEDTLEAGVRFLTPGGVISQAIEGVQFGWREPGEWIQVPVIREIAQFFGAIIGFIAGLIIGVLRDVVYDGAAFLLTFFKNAYDLIALPFRDSVVANAEDMNLPETSYPDDFKELKKGNVGWALTPYPTRTVTDEVMDDNGKLHKVEVEVVANDMHVKKQTGLAKAGAYLGFTFILEDGGRGPK